MSDNQNTVGHLIRARRDKMGWSQEQLGEKCGIHRCDINGIECKRITLGAKRAMVLAKVLKLKVDDLYKPVIGKAKVKA